MDASTIKAIEEWQWFRFTAGVLVRPWRRLLQHHRGGKWNLNVINFNSNLSFNRLFYSSTKSLFLSKSNLFPFGLLLNDLRHYLSFRMIILSQFRWIIIFSFFFLIFDAAEVHRVADIQFSQTHHLRLRNIWTE